MATTTRTPDDLVDDGRDHLDATRRRHPAGRLRPGRATGTCLAILGLVGFLTLFGLVMVISASSVTDLKEHGTTWYSFKRQALWAIVGTFGLVLAIRVHYRRWRRWAGPMLIASIAMLVLVLVPGVGAEANGASRWIGVGALRVQPSEFAKLAVLLFVAKLLSDREREGKARVAALTLKPTLVVFGAVAALLMLQPNLGTTIALGAIVLTMLFIHGARVHHLGGIALLGAGAAAFLALQASYRRARVTAFLNPWADPSDTGYQTIQSLVGIASGGLFGVGLGASRAKYEFLPEAHTDFIFAIVAEELGLLGAAVVIGAVRGPGLLRCAGGARHRRPLRSPRRHRHHHLVRRAGLHQHRRHARHHAGHRGAVAVRLVRTLFVGGHPGRSWHPCQHRLARRVSPRRPMR